MSENEQLHDKVVTSVKAPKKLKFELPNLIDNFQNNKRLRFNLMALIVIIVSVTGISWWNHRLALRQAKLESMSKVIEGLSPLQQSLYYSDQGEYKLSEKVWSDQLSKVKDTQTKLDIYFRQSATAVKFKKYTDAQKYADQAVLLAPNSTSPYVALAEIAKAKGDKALAKKYLQKSITLLDKKLPEYNLVIRDYQTLLDGLK